MEEKFFNNLWKAFFEAKRMSAPALAKAKTESFGVVIINLAQELWERIDGSIDFRVFEPVPITVRGVTETLPLSRCALGTDKYRVFIEKARDGIMVIVKLLDWSEARTAVLEKDGDVVIADDFTHTEIVFNGLEPGDYVLYITSKGNKSIAYCELKLRN